MRIFGPTGCRSLREDDPSLLSNAVYVIELALRMSPVPVSVQRKEHSDAEALYQQIRQALENGQPRLMELTCEKVEGKKVALEPVIEDVEPSPLWRASYSDRHERCFMIRYTAEPRG